MGTAEREGGDLGIIDLTAGERKESEMRRSTTMMISSDYLHGNRTWGEIML